MTRVAQTGAENVQHTTDKGDFLGTLVGESQELFCGNQFLSHRADQSTSCYQLVRLARGTARHE